MILRSQFSFFIEAVAIVAVIAACGASDDRGASDSLSSPTGGGPGPSLGSFGSPDAGNADARASCPPLPGTTAVTLAPQYASAYSVYELGPVPGAPAGTHVGGTTVLAGTTDTLLVSAGPETAAGAIYKVKIKRDACDHIVAYDGVATRIADAPFADANLLYGPGGILLFLMTGGPEAPHQVGQMLPGATSPVVTDAVATGIASGRGGAAGFVPPSIPAAEGELRFLVQNEETHGGDWYHVGYKAGGPSGSLALSNAVKTLTVPNLAGGGFAYVPAGSPGFTAQSIIAVEVRGTSVATYEVDGKGDPIVSTHTPFFTQIPNAFWGTYFEPMTGDYLFLQWGTGTDSVFVVSGFEPPPPPPPQMPK